MGYFLGTDFYTPSPSKNFRRNKNTFLVGSEVQIPTHFFFFFNCLIRRDFFYKKRWTTLKNKWGPDFKRAPLEIWLGYAGFLLQQRVKKVSKIIFSRQFFFIENLDELDNVKQKKKKKSVGRDLNFGTDQKRVFITA